MFINLCLRDVLKSDDRLHVGRIIVYDEFNRRQTHYRRSLSIRRQGLMHSINCVAIICWRST